MAETGIVTINLALAVTAASAQDYSTLMIMDCNHFSFERTAVYASVADYSSVLPSGSTIRSALDSAFSASVKPAQVIYGRVKGSSTITPLNVADTVQYDFTVTVSTGDSAIASYTAGAADTAEDVCTALKADIDAVTEVVSEITATVVGTGADAVLQITLDATASDFTLTNVSSTISAVSLATETPADAIQAIQNSNNQWTWICSTDHRPASQLATAATAETLKKPYVTSTALVEAYSSWNGVDTPSVNDVGATLRFNNYTYSHCMYHHEADDSFPECVRVTEFTWLKPGRDNFALVALAGVPLAQRDDSGGGALTTTDLTNLESKSMSTIVRFGGQNVVGCRTTKIGNRMANGTRMETVAVAIYTKQEIERTTETFLLKNRKAGMNDVDISKLVNRWQKFFDENATGGGVTRAFQSSKPVVITVPRAKDISFEDKSDGILQNVEIIGYLDPSIDSVVATITLTFEDPTEA